MGDSIELSQVGWISETQMSDLVREVCKGVDFTRPVSFTQICRSLNSLKRGYPPTGPLKRMGMRGCAHLLVPIWDEYHWSAVFFLPDIRVAFAYDPSGAITERLRDAVALCFEVTDLSVHVVGRNEGCGVRVASFALFVNHANQAIMTERVIRHLDAAWATDTMRVEMLRWYAHEEDIAAQEMDWEAQMADVQRGGTPHQRLPRMGSHQGLGVMSTRARKQAGSYRHALRALFGAVRGPNPRQRIVMHMDECRTTYMEAMGGDPDAMGVRRMGVMAEQGHTVFACTNSRGRGGVDNAPHIFDAGRIGQLADMVASGLVDVLGICETKMKVGHALALHEILSAKGLIYRTGYMDDTSSRGVILIWRKDFPYVCHKVAIDGAEKRVIVVTFRGAKGTSIVVSCSYVEDGTMRTEDQRRIYDFIGRHVPRGRSAKHMFIDMGDKNVALTPTQRLPQRHRLSDNNHAVLSFAHTHRLTEVITDDVPNGTHIYTRTSGISKAKLDHIHLNEASLAAHSSSGWTETNPVTPGSDHGFAWVSFRPQSLQQIRSSKKAETREVIRTNGAGKHTHGKYTGVPMRVMGKAWAKARKGEAEMYIINTLRDGGYTAAHFTHSTTHYKHLHEDMRTCVQAEMDAGLRTRTGPILTDMRQGLKWRNHCGEWWVHAVDDPVAGHMMSRGVGLPAMNDHIVTTVKPPDWAAHPLFSNWYMQVGHDTNRKAFGKYLHDVVGVPKDIIEGFDKLDQDGDQNVSGPYLWSVLFKEPEDRAFWTLYGTSLDPRPITFRYATGWTSYTTRIEEILGAENTRTGAVAHKRCGTSLSMRRQRQVRARLARINDKLALRKLVRIV